MAVAVISPHDCLKDPSRQPLISSPMGKSIRIPNPNRASRTPQPDRRKRKPARPHNSLPARPAAQKTPPANNLVMGQVKILKRGDELTRSDQPSPAVKENREVSDLGSTHRLGPDPKSVKLVPKQSRLDSNRVSKQTLLAESNRIPKQTLLAESNRVSKQTPPAESDRVPKQTLLAESNRVPKQTRPAHSNRFLEQPGLASGFYAGSASCVTSPPPSSLPLPSFFAKKGVTTSTDEAASEILKLLRLNLS